jgi:hypothetical protein
LCEPPHADLALLMDWFLAHHYTPVTVSLHAWYRRMLCLLSFVEDVQLIPCKFPTRADRVAAGEARVGRQAERKGANGRRLGVSGLLVGSGERRLLGAVHTPAS